MTEITWKECKNKVLRMLLVQLSAYALLIAAAAVTLPGADPTAPRVVACLTLVVFLVFWPLRGTMLDRVVTMLFGAASRMYVTVPFPAGKVPPHSRPPKHPLPPSTPMTILPISTPPPDRPAALQTINHRHYAA